MCSKQVLSLYRALIRASKKFPSYNYRCYALRRIKDAFREHKSITDSSEINRLYEEGCRNLGIIKRQAAIGEMYRTDPLVIEKNA